MKEGFEIEKATKQKLTVELIVMGAIGTTFLLTCGLFIFSLFLVELTHAIVYTKGHTLKMLVLPFLATIFISTSVFLGIMTICGTILYKSKQ